MSRDNEDSRSEAETWPHLRAPDDWGVGCLPADFHWMLLNELSNQEFAWSEHDVTSYQSIWHFIGGPRLLGAIYSSGISLGVAFKANHEIDGLLLSRESDILAGVSRFEKVDDFQFSNELISQINTAGVAGPSALWAEENPAPPAYRDLKVQSMGDRIEGEPHVQGVLVSATARIDLQIVLAHTAYQARVEGLI